MANIFEFSTASTRPEHRLESWSEQTKTIGGMRHCSVDHGRFDGRVKLVSLDGLKVGRFKVTANEARWTNDLIKRAPDSFLRLILQCRGEAEIEQGDARFTLRPGQWALLNASRPHMIRSAQTMEELVAIVPRSALSARLFDASGHGSLPQQADRGTSKLLFDFLMTVIKTAEFSPSVEGYLGAAGLEMVRAVIQERFDNRAVSTCRDLRLERIHDYIERNLCDPDLSVQSVADAMGCSKRYIHSLFAGSESVHNLIWRSRLERSARELRRRDCQARSVTEVAFSHGFSCPAHFSRMFKSRYGVPPRKFRERLLDS